MDKNKLYKMIDFAHDRLNETDELGETTIFHIGVCIGEARKTLFDILNQMDEENETETDEESEDVQNHEPDE